MTHSAVTQAWRQARQNQQSCYAVIEAGLLSDAARLKLMQSELSRFPLMRQPEFAALREFGPWLVDFSDYEFDQLLAYEGLADGRALMGWISSECLINDLAEHLSEALLAQDLAGTVYLLRSYTPAVLPVLHSRAETAWHNWLFSPVHQWWLPAEQEGWQVLAGHARKQASAYQPIVLDEPLWTALELDPLIYSLTTELEDSAVEVFHSDCHGDRLAQVADAVSRAREEGLQQPDDISLFATLRLFDPQFPASLPEWPQVLAKVQEQQTLANVLRDLAK